MDTTNTETQAPVITLSEAAIKEVKRLINVQGITEGGLRLGVKGGGCSGLSYTINFDEKIGQYDQVYDFDGVKVIVDAKFKTFGCGSAIASSSLATEWLKGKTIEEAQKIKNTDIVQELNLPPVKIHCSVLAEDAIKAALSDYKKKAEPK